MATREADLVRNRVLRETKVLSRLFVRRYADLWREVEWHVKAGAAADTVLDLFQDRLALFLTDVRTAIRGARFGAVGETLGQRFELPEVRMAYHRIYREALANVRAALRRGLPPAQAAVAARREASVALTRALTVTRTEAMNALRRAEGQRIRRSPEVNAWVWRSRLDPKTCAWCLFNHGQVFDQKVNLADLTHPNCRCTMVPHVKGTPVPFPTGEEWLEQQPRAVQNAILHPVIAEAWRRGAVTLRRIARPGGGRRSLVDALGSRRAVDRWRAVIAPPPRSPVLFRSLDDVLEGLPTRRVASLGVEARTFPDHVALGPKFDRLSPEAQRAVLAHEAAHFHRLDDWFLSAHGDWNLAGRTRFGHLNGHTDPGEVIAEAWSVAWTDPRFLIENAPDLIPILQEGAAAVGLPLPEVIARFGRPMEVVRRRVDIFDPGRPQVIERNVPATLKWGERAEKPLEWVVQRAVRFAERVTGRRSNWNGVVGVDEFPVEAYAGVKNWDCSIGLSEFRLRQRPTELLGTILHEAFHSVSLGIERASAYPLEGKLEEALTEAFTRRHLLDFARSVRYPLDDYATRIFEGRTSYDSQFQALDELADILVTETDWLVSELYTVPIGDRTEWLAGFLEGVAEDEGWSEDERLAAAIAIARKLRVLYDVDRRHLEEAFGHEVVREVLL